MSHTVRKEANTALKGNYVHLHNRSFFRPVREKMHISIIEIQLSQAINWYFTRAVLQQG